METTFKLALDEWQYAKLQALAKERGLTPDEMARLVFVSGVNWRYRALRLEQLALEQAERLAKGAS